MDVIVEKIPCALCKWTYAQDQMLEVRYLLGKGKAYAVVCATCQDNILRARRREARQRRDR
jgi:hypothetical protein